MKRALARLTTRQRVVIQLRSLDFRYGEIGTMLGVSESVVGQDLMHARQKIDKELRSYGQGKVRR